MRLISAQFSAYSSTNQYVFPEFPNPFVHDQPSAFHRMIEKCNDSVFGVLLIGAFEKLSEKRNSEGKQGKLVLIPLQINTLSLSFPTLLFDR